MSVERESKNILRAATRGGARKGSGRPRGSPNAVTKDTREAFNLLVQANIPKFNNWIDQVAQESPARAMGLVLRAAEFVLPRLQKTELRIPLTGSDGEPIVVTDSAQAATIYAQLMRGDVALDAVRFAPGAATAASSPAPSNGMATESVASATSNDVLGDLVPAASGEDIADTYRRINRTLAGL